MIITNQATRGHKDVNEMEVVLLDIVQSNYCYYNPYLECLEDLEAPDNAVCGKCLSESDPAIIQDR